MKGHDDTIKTISLCSDTKAKPYGLYQMTVLYDYSIENIANNFTKLVNRGLPTDIAAKNAINLEIGLENNIEIGFNTFGCTAFHVKHDSLQCHYMGRNYDNGTNTSAMMVRCEPSGGFKSIAFAALSSMGDFLTDPLSLEENRKATLALPFLCLDGINENGVSIAVLVNGDNEYSNPPSIPGVQPTHQTYKDGLSIFTTLAIRLVLDRAKSTDHAIQLLEAYNMVATGKFDYHFYISDATGNGKIVEYDCKDQTRKDTISDTEIATNFFIKYIDDVKPGIPTKYGHGRERYDAVQNVLKQHEGSHTDGTVWEALQASQQIAETYKPSNTQWSICYNNTKLTANVVFRRLWNQEYIFMVKLV